MNVIFFDEDFSKSSLCPHRGLHCVAVAYKDGIIGIKDTKDPNKMILRFNKSEWSAFIQGVKNGEFEF